MGSAKIHEGVSSSGEDLRKRYSLRVVLNVLIGFDFFLSIK